MNNKTATLKDPATARAFIVNLIQDFGPKLHYHQGLLVTQVNFLGDKENLEALTTTVEAKRLSDGTMVTLPMANVLRSLEMADRLTDAYVAGLTMASGSTASTGNWSIQVGVA